MRGLGPLLCLVACTIENPAFFTTPTDATGTVASTSSATTDDSGSATGGSAPTTSTSGADATSAPGSTTGTTTDDTGTTTTGWPATSSTTEPAMTSSSETGDTTSGGPDMCPLLGDPLGPYLQMFSLPGPEPVSTAACADSQGKVIGGRFFADANGFTITKDFLCQPDILLVGGLYFPVPLPPEVPGDGQCVQLTFLAHPEYEECKVAAVQVTREQKPVLAGSFGLTEYPDAPLEVAHAPKNLCACDGCYGPEAPDPDVYKFVAEGVAIDEGFGKEIMLEGAPYLFTNLRSHVHSPECMVGDLPRADWLHLDWILARLP